MTHDPDIPSSENDAGQSPGHSSDDAHGDDSTSADAYVQRLLDGDLAPHEESDALHAIADDAEARSTLRFELQWSPAAARSAASPPPQFADNVMAAILEDAPSTAENSLSDDGSVRDRITRWLESLSSPVELRVHPLPAFLVILGIMVGVWGLRGTIDPTSLGERRAPIAEQTTGSGAASGASQPEETTRIASESGETVWIRFVYTGDAAESVAVAGDFSKWEPIPLSSRTVNGQIIWTGLVPVRRGEHEYQFVINGERWVTDPLAPIQRNDGFGATNAVLKL